MKDDNKLYDELSGRMAQFVTTEGLDKVGHSNDTQVNESLNQSVSWLAPKNKYYSGSQSLQNCIACVLCINALGILAFYEKVFEKLGIPMPSDTQHYLQWRDNRQSKRLLISKTPKQKKKRQKRFHDKMKEHAEDAKKQKAKREGGLYMPGIGLDGGYIIAKEDLPEKPKSKCKKSTTPNVCLLPLCLRKGHKTKRSQQCKNRIQSVLITLAMQQLQIQPIWSR